MNLTASLIKEIEADIERCNQHTVREGSRALYNDLVAKYVVIDSEFEKGLSIMGKVTFPGQEFDFCPELRAIANKLHMWLVLDDSSQENKEMKGKGKSVMEENNKVFIVHGHDEDAKQSVARFLEKCGFEAVILHEQADGGSTIIEKIEKYTDVIYAIVLYTPCDVGHAKEEKKNKPRARQNVVFEHGYLIGKLGRDRVCALVKQDVDTPGDISGVVYKSMDTAGAWRTEILREMKNVGIAVDASKLL